MLQQFRCTNHQVGGLFEFGLKGPLEAFGDLRHILLANVQPRADRQPDRSPPGMTHDHCQRHPDMSVAKRIAAGTRRRIMMDACPLDTRSVAFGGGIVDGQEHALLAFEDRQQKDQQSDSQFLPSPPDTLQKEVEALKVVADAGGPNPRSDHSPATGEQRSQQHDREPPRRTTMQRLGQPLNLIFPFPRCVIRCHPWLSEVELML
jgi:hypothetical protein